jgi:hypothetical protein
MGLGLGLGLATLVWVQDWSLVIKMKHGFQIMALLLLVSLQRLMLVTNSKWQFGS